jgi:hypothetical protein
MNPDGFVWVKRHFYSGKYKGDANNLVNDKTSNGNVEEGESTDTRKVNHQRSSNALSSRSPAKV